MLVDLSERKHVQQEHLHRALIPFDIEDLGKPQKNEAKTESVASGMVLSPLAAESLFRWSALVDRKNEKRNNNHDSVNFENSSVSFVMKYCPTSTVVRNPASVKKFNHTILL